MAKGGCSCPMTAENCEKYGISDKRVKNFCKAGCSVICNEEFEKEFVLAKKEYCCAHGHKDEIDCPVCGH